MTKIIAKEYTEFLEQLKDRIAASHYKAARTVNKELLLLYHYIGTRILEKQKSQGWGAKVIEQLSRDLKAEFPEMKGFGIANLHNMRRFAEIYPNPEFLQQVAGILPWYHHVVLMERVKDHEARLFYVRNASEYGWSRAIMIHQIELGLHKRQGKAMTNFKEKLPYPTSDLANQTLKDPYIFDFLSIGKDAHEREIEKGLVAHIEKFLLELGAGFSFVGRQYHLTVRQKDYYLDLKYCPSLPPLIAGGMIGSMLLLAVCTLVGILLLIDRTFFDKIYCNIYDQKKINEKAEFFDKLSKCILPLIAGAVVSFGVGAGLAALGLESPLAIAVLAAVACKVIMSLFSAITERFSSPPTPPGSSVDSDVKVDNTSPNPSYVLPN